MRRNGNASNELYDSCNGIYQSLPSNFPLLIRLGLPSLSSFFRTSIHCISATDELLIISARLYISCPDTPEETHQLQDGLDLVAISEWSSVEQVDHCGFLPTVLEHDWRLCWEVGTAIEGYQTPRCFQPQRVWTERVQAPKHSATWWRCLREWELTELRRV